MREPIKMMIHPCFEGWTVRDVLLSYHVAKKWVNHTLQIKKVQINDAVAKGDEVVHVGDQMTIDFGDQLPKKPKAFAYPIEIIDEDDDLIIVNKPIHLLVYDDGKEEDSLTGRIGYYMQQKNYDYPVLPAHRIDEETSGMVLFAKHPLALSYFSHLFEMKSVHKVYHGLINSLLDKQKGTINRPIGREMHTNLMCIDPKGDDAITHYEVIDVKERISRLRITIDTGRKHQIRVHMASLGFPIIGDRPYKGKPAPRLMLHFRELELIHPTTRLMKKWVVPETF